MSGFFFFFFVQGFLVLKCKLLIWLYMMLCDPKVSFTLYAGD